MYWKQSKIKFYFIFSSAFFDFDWCSNTLITNSNFIMYDTNLNWMHASFHIQYGYCTRNSGSCGFFNELMLSVLLWIIFYNLLFITGPFDFCIIFFRFNFYSLRIKIHWPIFHYYLVIKIFDSISRQDIESAFSFDYCLKYLNISDSICCLCLVFSTTKNFCVEKILVSLCWKNQA